MKRDCSDSNGVQIKVLLVEDHTLVRKGIRSLLETTSHILVIDEAKNGLEALTKARRCQPDIVLMDWGMQPMDGLTATRILTREFPQTRVLMVTIHNDPEYIKQAKKAGAAGYLIKQASVHALIEAVEAIYRGQDFFEHLPSPPKNAGFHHNDELNPSLTRRELEVLKLMAQGFTLSKSGVALGISPKTVETHRSNIMRKLNIHTIAEITQYAIRHGLITLD